MTGWYQWGPAAGRGGGGGTHRVQDGMTADLQAGLGAGALGVHVPQLTLEEAHFVLKGLRTSCVQSHKNCVTVQIITDSF